MSFKRGHLTHVARHSVVAFRTISAPHVTNHLDVLTGLPYDTLAFFHLHWEGRMASEVKEGLTCREAQLLLKVIPKEKRVDAMSPTELGAFQHYIGCVGCLNLGLENITGTSITCLQALLVWAEHAGALWLYSNPGMPWGRFDSLLQQQGLEHVWGRYQRNAMGGIGYNNFLGCRKRCCQSLVAYWHSIPMSSGAGDGEQGVRGLYPWLLGIFEREGWPLDQLFKVQTARVAQLLADIHNGKLTASPGHYHSIDDLHAEVLGHVAALQELALRSNLTQR